MVTQLKGEVFGPYYCSNCRMRQPQAFRSCCVFCGSMFSNYEERLIEEDAERFLIHMKEAEKRNESNIS